MNPELEHQMNEMLDGLLSTEEEQAFKRQLLSSNQQLDMWQNMQLVDATLRSANAFSPSLDFTDSVMAQVDCYERELTWRPWLLTLLVLTSSLSVMSIATPLLFFALGLHNYLLKLPILGDGLRFITVIISYLVEALISWIMFATSDPVALGLIVTALVVISTYIGLRETQRITVRSQRAEFR